MNVMELIRQRRSVRSFDGTPLSEEDGKKILEFARKVENPYDLAIEWKLLDGMSSPVITGTDKYIAGKMLQVPNGEEAFGYAFEKVVLYATSLGVGTTWMAGTMDRGAFEKAINVKDGEIMPCISPLGYPAKKMAFREMMMRKGIKADSRMDFESLFFDGSFDRPLSREKAGKLEEALEAVRMGPSAVNKQPWRLVVDGNRVHFYEKPGRGMGGSWDVQKIDMGIALCHFEMAALQSGLKVSFEIADPGIKAEGMVYIASYVIEE